MQDYSPSYLLRSFNPEIKSLYGSFLLVALKLIRTDLMKGHQADNPKSISWYPFTITTGESIGRINLLFPRKTIKDLQITLTNSQEYDEVLWNNGTTTKLSFLTTLKRVCKLSTGNYCELLCNNIASILNIYKHLIDTGLINIITGQEIFSIGMSTIELQFKVPDLMGHYTVSACTDKLIFSFSSSQDKYFRSILTTEDRRHMEEAIVLEVLSKYN